MLGLRGFAEPESVGVFSDFATTSDCERLGLRLLRSPRFLLLTSRHVDDRRNAGRFTDFRRESTLGPPVSSFDLSEVPR